MKFSKFIVVLVILLNIAFTTAALILVSNGVNEPSALIGAWFAFTTVELWNLKDIKVKEAAPKKKKVIE